MTKLVNCVDKNGNEKACAGIIENKNKRREKWQLFGNKK